MSSLIVRNVDDAIIQALKSRAARHGRSAEAEHRALLADALLNTRRRSLAQVLAAKLVGDLLGRFIDVNGEELGPPSQDRVIGISVADLGKIEVVVGLAAGKAKAQGVLSALRTGTLDLLVVDEGLAAALLSLAATSPAAVGQSV